MNAYIYNYDGDTVKHLIRIVSANISVREDEELYAIVTCPSDELYKGNIVLGDLIALCYPHPNESGGQMFRIVRITAEDDLLTIKARHISYDFDNAFCSDGWVTQDLRLLDFATRLNDTSAVKNGNVTFEGFYHSNLDDRYERKHQCSISFRGGQDILDRIKTIYGCNFIRDGKKIILTYGTASDYFRAKYNLPTHSVIYRQGRNVTGYTAELSNEDIVTCIAAFYEIKDADGNDKLFTAGRVYKAGLTTKEANKHLVMKKYSSEIEQGEMSWADWNTAVKNDVKKQAQDEVNNEPDVEQNVSIDTSSITGDFIFGGESCICADERTQTDMMLNIVAFDFDIVSQTYNNIQLGRASFDLRDLAKKKG